MLTRHEESELAFALEDFSRSFMNAVKSRDYTYSFSPDIYHLKNLLEEVVRRILRDKRRELGHWGKNRVNINILF